MKAETMLRLYKQGRTLLQIGEKLSCTGERVRQVLRDEYGVTGKDGGAHVTAQKRENDLRARRDASCMKKWGCSYEEYRVLKRRIDRPTYAYQQHRRNVLMKGGKWEITLYEWWDAWQQSGHWKCRGRGIGTYCMSLRNPTGRHSAENVIIMRSIDSIKRYYTQKVAK